MTLLVCPEGCEAPIHGVCTVNPYTHKGFHEAKIKQYTDGTPRMWCAECGHIIGADTS